jgi:hypothetical protein
MVACDGVITSGVDWARVEGNIHEKLPRGLTTQKLEVEERARTGW